MHQNSDCYFIPILLDNGIAVRNCNQAPLTSLATGKLSRESKSLMYTLSFPYIKSSDPAFNLYMWCMDVYMRAISSTSKLNLLINSTPGIHDIYIDLDTRFDWSNPVQRYHCM